MVTSVRLFGPLAALMLCVCLSGNAAPLAPNLVPIHTNLITAGQPSAEQLGKLAAQGFEAVIYLAPPTVPDAVRDEALIIAKQGLLYINLPVRFGNPTEKDFQTFAALLTSLGFAQGAGALSGQHACLIDGIFIPRHHRQGRSASGVPKRCRSLGAGWAMEKTDERAIEKSPDRF